MWNLKKKKTKLMEKEFRGEGWSQRKLEEGGQVDFGSGSGFDLT